MANLGDEGPAERTTTLEWSPSKSILMKCGFHWWAWRRFSSSVNVLLVMTTFPLIMCSVLD